jgi:ATP-dependent Clp protease, protease subunit
MGSLLLAGGAPGKRLSLPNARILIHQPSGGYQGQSADIEIQAREILRMRSLLETLLARHSGRSPEQVKEDIERDKILTAEEAVEYGLIDEVIQSRKLTTLSG